MIWDHTAPPTTTSIELAVNLEQLRTHPSFPFTGFMGNDLEFLLLEMFWVELFRSCFENPEQIAYWEPLYPAERDGSPILVMANNRSSRAFRVLMRINKDNLPLYERKAPDVPGKYFLPFDLWLTDILNSTGEKRYSGLVVSTDMSPSALSLAEKAMSAFCKDEFSTERMRSMIDEYYKVLDERGYHWK